MPKIISYTPAWLSRPAPGFKLFSSSTKPSLSGSLDTKSENTSVNGKNSHKYLGPRRILARRGNDIFVVVGNTIRWANLCTLRDVWEEPHQSIEDIAQSPRGKGISNGAHDAEEKDLSTDSYRTLKVPVSEQIRQLVPSPNGDLLAIVTSHTVHIAILPDSSHLAQPDTGPIRLKTHTLGPTTHVLSQSPVASALWHPLGVAGNCLVTVTAEAVVRIWELNRENRWSFDSPTLAIDLKKLANGKSAEDDFSAAGIGRNRGFSLDGLDMEVASACFGGTGSDTESGWPSMTLWIAMKEGDVYALCPLLPSKWQCPDTVVSVLTTATVAKAGFMQDEMCTLEEQRQCDEQYQWMTEVDKQEPISITEESEFSKETKVYERPTYPGPIPKLQGPFRILPDEIEEDLELSDIYVIASKVDSEELLRGEEQELDYDAADEAGLSTSVVCLLTRTGRVLVCLDLDGVEARWLPSKKLKTKYTSQAGQQPQLVVLEALDTLQPDFIADTEWPAFSPDVRSPYSFFVTHSQGVFFVSIDPWLANLESELQSTSNAGAEFRMGVLVKGSGCLREYVLRPERSDEADDDGSFATCIILQNSDLGYFLMTVAGEQPQAIIFDAPENELLPDTTSASDVNHEPDVRLLTVGPTRAAYQPPKSFWAASSLSTFVDTHVQSRHRKTLKEEIRLSTATLDLVTAAHRVLSQETYQLGIAAADLFRRCERLQEEFRDQIRRANEVASRIDQVNGEDADDYEEKERVRGSEKINERLEVAKSRQQELAARHEALRRKLAKASARDLSEKEQAWVVEVKKLGSTVLEPTEDHDEEHEHELWQRYQEARELAADLISHSQKVTADDGPQSSNPNKSGTFRVPPDIRKAKVAQVMGLLERETALVDATQQRLERLSLSSVS